MAEIGRPLIPARAKPECPYQRFVRGIAACLCVVAMMANPARGQEGENPIPVSGGALIMPANGPPDPLSAGWNGRRVCELLQETESLRALRCVFPPGVGHERHFHAPHFGYVIEGGTMRITDRSGTRVQETKSGNSWTSGRVTEHEVLNLGDTTAVYIIVEPKDVKR